MSPSGRGAPGPQHASAARPSSSTVHRMRARAAARASATFSGSRCAAASWHRAPPGPGQVDAAPVGERRHGELGDLLERRPRRRASAQEPAGLDEQPLAELGALGRGDVLGDVHHERRRGRRRPRRPSPWTRATAGRRSRASTRRRSIGGVRARRARAPAPRQLVVAERAPVGVVEREPRPTAPRARLSRSSLERLGARAARAPPRLASTTRPSRVAHGDGVLHAGDQRLELALGGSEPRVVDRDREAPGEHAQEAQVVGVRSAGRRARRRASSSRSPPARAQRRDHGRAGSTARAADAQSAPAPRVARRRSATGRLGAGSAAVHRPRAELGLELGAPRRRRARRQPQPPPSS